MSVCVFSSRGSVKGCAMEERVGGRGAFPSFHCSSVQRLHSLHHSGGLQRASHDTKPTRNSRNVFPVFQVTAHTHTQSTDHRPVCAAASTVAYCTFVVCTESVLLALPLSSHAGPFKSTFLTIRSGQQLERGFKIHILFVSVCCGNTVVL